MSIEIFILIAGIFLGVASGYFGSLVLSKRMSIVVDPLSHLALPGALIGLIIGTDISLTAFLFLIFSAVIIWYLERLTKLPTETIIAILFSSSLAISFLFLEEEELHKIFVGDIFQINYYEAFIVILISFALIIFLKFYYDKLLLISISEELALSQKINVKVYQLAYLLLLVSIISIGIKYVGSLLVAGLIALPSASARNLAKNLKSYKILSISLSLFSVVLGIGICFYFNIASGAVIIVLSFIFFVFSTVLKLIFKKV